jgi:asparagine synthase (glutamine-hydrolysing)
MCGIAGSINLPFNTDIVNTIMGHRGPDHNASYQYENLLLHHLRLSIVDIDGGAQPMHYKQRYTIIFNGEIYNHNQIRTQLSLNCITKSDTETILHAWHLLGPRCLTLFDGMFAFALFDKEKNELYLVRDRAGKKPLHIYNNGQSIFFASELNAIKAVAPLQIDEESIGFYFRLGACYRSRTPYKNVEELLNGHYIKLNITTLEQEKVKWWDIQDYYRKPIKIDDNSAINNVEEILNEAVRRRIDSSDLEVGAFLSGGIDSGLIVAMAAKHSTKLKTFTVKFEGQFDESHLAEKVAKKYETVHQTLSINFDHLKYDLETILKNYG